MLFVYAPEGAKKRTWEFEPQKLMSPEAEAIERHTGMTYQKWTEAVSEGSILALHGLLFVMLKREEPTLKWDSVQFCLDDVDFELDDNEVAEAIVKLESLSNRTEKQEVLLATLRASQEEAPKDASDLAEDHENSDDSV